MLEIVVVTKLVLFLLLYEAVSSSAVFVIVSRAACRRMDGNAFGAS